MTCFPILKGLLTWGCFTRPADTEGDVKPWVQTHKHAELEISTEDAVAEKHLVSVR